MNELNFENLLFAIKTVEYSRPVKKRKKSWLNLNYRNIYKQIVGLYSLHYVKQQRPKYRIYRCTAKAFVFFSQEFISIFISSLDSEKLK